MRGGAAVELSFTNVTLKTTLVTSPLSFKGGRMLRLTLSFVIHKIEPILVNRVGAIG